MKPSQATSMGDLTPQSVRSGNSGARYRLGRWLSLALFSPAGVVALAIGCGSNENSPGANAANNSGVGSNNSGVGSSNSGVGSNNGFGSNTGAGTVPAVRTDCIIGSQGCSCDVLGACSSGQTCKNGTCCDSALGSCTLLPSSSGSGGNTGATVTTVTGTGTNDNTGAPGTNTGTGSTGSVCTPGVTGPVIAPCGYPYASGNPLTSVIFNEDECLGGIEAVGGSLAAVKLFYTDEHAMTLGVRSVVVKSASGTVTKDYPVSPLSANPGAVQNPQTGSNILFGDQAGLDQMMRPMWPSLFITDTTSDPNSRIGDWQFGGRPFNPTAVFGSWKAAVRNVDSTVNPPVVSITPDADPAKNGLDLGPGADPMPAAVAALKNEGYHTEVVWYLPLIPGHTYRVQVIVHDGDQNKVGGDVGEACVDYCAGGNNPPPPNDGGVPPNQSTTPPPDCGPDSHVCGSGSTDPTYVCPTRSDGAVGHCINGCCMYVG